MALSPSVLATYHRQGYVPMPGFFTAAEVALLRSELDRLVAEGKLRNVATVGDGKTHSDTKVNLQICPIGPHSRPIRALPFSDKVLAAVTALLGCPVRQRLDQVFLKPGGSGVGTSWHQDNGYFKEFQGAEASRGLGMWIAIHDATVANGTMHVLPAVHEQVLAHVRDGGSDHHVTCAAVVDETRAVPIELPAGGVLFFNYGVPHRTGPNTTERPRAGLALHFQDAAISIPGSDHVRMPLLSGPGAVGGAAEYDEDLRGVWDAEVSGLLAGVR